MSGRGDRGRGRGAPRGRGDAPRGASPQRGGPPAQGARGGAPPSRGPPSGFRGGPGARGGPPRGGAPASAAPPRPVAAPPLGPATLDQRISTIEKGIEAFKKVPKAPEHPLRPGFGTVGVPIVVRANFFALKFAKNLVIHEYKIQITPITGVARLKGRIIECLEQSPDYAKYKPFVAHDKSERMVAARALPQPLVVEVTFVEEGETTAQANAKKYRVEISKTGELDTNDLTKHVDGDPANRDLDIGPLVSALNLIVQTSGARNGTRVGRNRHFFGPAQGSLSNGVEAWRGYFASVRPVWKTLMVNINVCMTAFIETQNMADAIMNFQRGSRGAVPHLGAMFGKSPLRVKTQHLGHRKGVWAIGHKTANQERFSCEEFGGMVSVAEFFKKKYNISLKYPDLPLLNIGNARKSVYVPAELCDIVKGLPFRGRLNDQQTSNMLRAALRTPKENSELIRGDGFAKLGIAPGSVHETLQNFGITIDQNMAVIPARILPPPGLTYGGNNRPRVADGSWNLNEVKFHRGGNIGRLTVMIIREQNRPHPWQGPDDQGMWDFIKAFAKRCQTAGMTLSAERPLVQPTPPLPPGGPNDPSRSAALRIIKDKMAALAGANPRPTFILVILNNRDNYIYPGLKRIGDVELGIHTVCMQYEKAYARGDPKKQDQYFSNVALKVNTKLGGINHKLDAKDLRWLQEKKTMVIGADVTHPGPTSADGTPSLAAVVASIDSDFVLFPASMELQASKQEMIQNFTGMLVERLKLYEGRNKSLPERVILFRDGVSEGQFDTVLQEELPQIREAFRKVYKEGKKPLLMICICGKRHHARFYPANANDETRNGNTKPGTIVDKGIGDVYRFDFYLQAHAGLQGTVKATHYTVVYDEIGLNADTMQLGTHSQSYSYVRATKAVSLVPPAYYADLACERGRLYLNDLFNLGAEKTITSGATLVGDESGPDAEKVQSGGHSPYVRPAEGVSRVPLAYNANSAKKAKDAAAQDVYNACVQGWGEGIHARVKNSMFYI